MSGHQHDDAGRQVPARSEALAHSEAAAQHGRLRADITVTLTVIERELRRLDAWESSAPSADRLASDVPFAHDTLEFTQWVQWIFIPRFRAVLEGNHPLPTACAISPVAEDALEKLAGDTAALFDAFRALDHMISTQDASRG